MENWLKSNPTKVPFSVNPLAAMIYELETIASGFAFIAWDCTGLHLLQVITSLFLCPELFCNGLHIAKMWGDDKPFGLLSTV